METTNNKPVLGGYLKSVAISLSLLFIWIIASSRFDDWFFFVFLLVAIVGTLIHFVFLLLHYVLIFPLITRKEVYPSQSSLKALMERRIPYFAIPVGLIIITLWFTDSLNKYFVFVMLDLLFTCYIGLYFYLKNKYT